MKTTIIILTVAALWLMAATTAYPQYAQPGHEPRIGDLSTPENGGPQVWKSDPDFYPVASVPEWVDTNPTYIMKSDTSGIAMAQEQPVLEILIPLGGRTILARFGDTVGICKYLAQTSRIRGRYGHLPEYQGSDISHVCPVVVVFKQVNGQWYRRDVLGTGDVEKLCGQEIQYPEAAQGPGQASRDLGDHIGASMGWQYGRAVPTCQQQIDTVQAKLKRKAN